MQNSFKIKPIISILLIVVIAFTLIAVIGKVLIPFLVALILTYIINPLVEKITHRFKIKRSIISFIFSILFFLLFLVIPLYIIPTIAIQVKAIISNIPDLITLFNNNILQTINTKYGTNLTIDLDNIKSLLINNFGNFYNHVNIFSPLAKNSFIVIEVLVYIILVPFILFYSTNNWHQIINFFDCLIPRSYTYTTHTIMKDIDHMLSSYLRGQISVMLIMAVYYGMALHFIGLPSGITVGILTGLLVFIPYLGISTGLLISLIIGFAAFTSMHLIFAIFIVFMVGHLIESGLITPFLVGGKIGLNPVMIILALMIFGKLLGFIGVLLALPLAAIAVVLLKYAKIYYLKSKYYKEEE